MSATSQAQKRPASFAYSLHTAVIWKTAPIAILGAYLSTAVVTIALGSLLF